MVQLGIACITAYEGCFDLILTRSTTLIVLNGKSEGAGVAKLKQVRAQVRHVVGIGRTFPLGQFVECYLDDDRLSVPKGQFL